MSLGSVGVCLIAAALAVIVDPIAGAVILVLPLVSAAGAVCSFVALRRIERAGGRLEGRPLAVAGLIVGFLAMILQGGVAAGALVTAASVRKHIVPLARSVVLAGARGDMTALRAALAPDASADLDDGTISRFFAELHRRHGPPRDAEFGLHVMLRAARELRRAASSAAPAQTITENPKPVELVFDGARLLAFIIPDEQVLQAHGRAAVADMIVLLPDGGVLTLRSNGPATALARRVGWTIHAPSSPPNSPTP